MIKEFENLGLEGLECARKPSVLQRLIPAPLRALFRRERPMEPPTPEQEAKWQAEREALFGEANREESRKIDEQIANLQRK